jgi:hypothetical protein
VDYRVDFFAHVVVLVADVKLGYAWKFVVYLAGKVFQFFFAALESVAVVVADYISEHCFFDGAFNGCKVIEPFVALGVFRSFPAREHDSKLVCYSDRVYHLVLC